MFDFKFILANLPVVLQAVPVTLYIAVMAILLSSLLGFILVVIIIKRIPILYYVATIFMSFSRSVPNLTILYFLYFAYPYFIGALHGDYSVNVGANKLNPIFVAIVTFTITFSVYFAEVFRSAYYSIDKGQFEAAQSVGLPDSISFLRIIFPQASVQALPNYTNVVIDVIKDTSLVYTITVVDIMGKANHVAAKSANYIAAYLIALIIYIVLCSLIAILLRYLKDRFSMYK